MRRQKDNTDKNRMCARQNMAKDGGAAMVSDLVGRERSVVKVQPEDYELVGKDRTAVKVICLGDSAVGKSK